MRILRGVAASFCGSMAALILYYQVKQLKVRRARAEHKRLLYLHLAQQEADPPEYFTPAGIAAVLAIDPAAAGELLRDVAPPGMKQTRGKGYRASTIYAHLSNGNGRNGTGVHHA